MTRSCYLLCLLLASLPLGCGRQPEPPETANPAPVKTIGVRDLAMGEWTEVLGASQALPDRLARITAPIEGRVLSILRDANGKPLAEGQQVEKGTVLVQLDPRLVYEQKKQAEFAVRLAEIEVRRLKALSLSGSPTGQLPLVSQVERERADIALADAQSRLKGLEEQVGLFTLATPIAGRLSQVQVVPGQTLAVGATVAEVVDLTEIDVLCFVPPAVAARLALEQTARIAAEKDDGQLAAAGLTGKVVFIAVQAQPDTGNFAVKVRFPNPNLQLRANTVCRVHVLTKPEEPRRTIPEAALMEDTDPPTVIVVPEWKEVTNADGKKENIGTARKLRAVLGVRDRRSLHSAEILALEDPENKEQYSIDTVQFVTQGGAGLESGDKVKLDEDED